MGGTKRVLGGTNFHDSLLLCFKIKLLKFLELTISMNLKKLDSGTFFDFDLNVEIIEVKDGQF